MKFITFEKMPIWLLGLEVANDIFHLTTNLPRSEDYGLTSQIRRSAVSIPANIAEGFGRESIADKRKFYIISRGSAFETKSHLIYGISVGYFDTEHAQTIMKKIEDLIYGINKLLKSMKPQP